MGIEFELLALRSTSSTHSSATFNMDLFYKEIIAGSGGVSEMTYTRPSDRFEDLLSR